MTNEGADLMKDAVKAAYTLSRLARENDDLRFALAALASANECRDIYDYASRFPEEVIGIAEAQEDLADQHPPGMRPI